MYLKHKTIILGINGKSEDQESSIAYSKKNGRNGKSEDQESSIAYSEKNGFYDYFKQLYKLRLKSKGLISNLAWKFCEDPLQKKLNEQISLNKIRLFVHPLEKSDDELESENNSVFSNQIVLYNQVSKKLETYLLNHMNKNQNNKNEVEEKKSFYYSDKSIYYVNYEISKVFFFNVSFPHNRMNNYYFEFGANLNNDSKTLVAKKMKFYFDNPKDSDKPQYLTDFSVCATKETIYLFWGSITNQTADLKDKNHGINPDVYAYSINNNEWNKLLYKNKKFSLMFPLPIARIKATSCVVEKQNKDVIYVFGGLGIENSEFDIYNIIDKFEVKKDEKMNIYFTKIQKSQYKDNYKPTNNALALFLPSTSKDSKKKEDKILLMGGTSSPYIYNQSAKLLSAYLIKFEKTKQVFENAIIYVEIENCMKNLKVSKKDESSNLEGLNLIISSANKNFFINYEKKYDEVILKEMIFIHSFFSNEQHGIFLDGDLKSQTKTFFTSKISNQVIKHIDIYRDGFQKFQKNLAYSIPLKNLKNLKNDLVNIVLLEKKQSATKFKMFIAQEFSAFLGKIDKDFILVSDDRPELYLLKFKKTKKMKANINTWDASEFDIAYLGYSFPDLKKTNYPYSDYLPSKIRTTNYSKLDDKIFILVNNAIDNNHKRAVYELNLRTVNHTNNMRTEPTRIFEEPIAVKGTTILVEYPSNIYLLGGELADKQKTIDLMKEFDQKTLNYNAVYDIANKSTHYLENNLKDMGNPYAFLYKEFIICLNRIYNGGSFLYGEFMNKSEVGIKKWIPFKVVVFTMEVKKGEASGEEINEKASIINLFSVGRVETKEDSLEAFLLECEQIKDPNKDDETETETENRDKRPETKPIAYERKKRMIFLSLKNLCQGTDKKYSEKFYEFKEKDEYQMDGDDGLYLLRDFDENESEEKKLSFFKSNLNVTSCSDLHIQADFYRGKTVKQ